MAETYMTRQDAEIGEGLYDSIAWIFEVHINEPDTKEYNFAVLHGNEDCPHAPHDRELSDGTMIWEPSQLEGCRAISREVSGLWLTCTWTPTEEKEQN